MELGIAAKRALIPGGSGGIALSVAQVLHDESVGPTLTDIDDAGIPDTAARIEDDVATVTARPEPERGSRRAVGFLGAERPYPTLGRRGKADESAAVAALLCSDRATFTNGSAFRLEAINV